MIYLDYNATAPLRPEVRQRASVFLEETYGNPSSLHALGRRARGALEEARRRLLALLGDPGGELIFTSGGTEADNLALKGVLWGLRGKKEHLILSAVEHRAVGETARALAEEGFQMTVIPVDRQGIVNLEALEEAITPKTGLISVMHANNEVGTIEPVEAIGRIARSHGVLFHTDAVQSFGKLPLDVKKIGADLASLSAHKLGGPKGAGALYVRRGISLKQLLHGGPHERQKRAGTEGVFGIVGMLAAAEAAWREKEDGTLQRISCLRDRLEQGLKAQVPEIRIQGHSVNRLGNTLNVSFLSTPAQTLLPALDMAGICVSTGSACSSGSTEPSHVLVAMGLSPQELEGSIRFSLGWGTTEAEIEEALERIPPVVERVRGVRVNG